jgi:signal transduction histidine kinase
MKMARFERFSIRTALAVGSTVTLALWFYTGVAFTQRIESLRRAATDAASRHMRAQESLSAMRASVLLSSVRMRDALLDPTPANLQENRRQIEVAYHRLKKSIDDYEPMLGRASQVDQVSRLSSAVDQFHETSMAILAEAANQAPDETREVLNRHIVPRRDAALAISEELQTLNRQAFITQQAEISTVHEGAEARGRRQLGIALIVGLASMLLSSLYATRLEARLRHQLQRDAKLSEDLQQMAGRVITAQEEERRLISRELHDEVGQVLGAVRIELASAQRAITAGKATAATLDEAQSITEGALKTVRSLSQLLHPSALDDLGLPAALEASLRTFERRYQVRASLHQVDVPPRLPRDVELAIFRIVQESINNIAKHARASQCDVRLTKLTDRMLIEVEDDGVGFIEDTDRPIVSRGLGLISIRERANRLHGTFNILSAPGEGTRLIVTLPEKPLASAALA